VGGAVTQKKPRRQLVLPHIARQHQRIDRDLGVLRRWGSQRERLVQQVEADVVDARIHVGEYDDADPSDRVESGEGATAARPAVVPHQVPDGTR